MKPGIAVCYYPEHWPEDIWAEDARRMVETGIRWVRIGEFAWSRLEAREGQYSWDWLDHAVEILAQAGLKIVMGTPSATPPRWVSHKYPDMLAIDRQGQPRRFGSRRHYCFSHPGYRQEAARIAGDMAKRYGEHPAVQAWQIDNEYGCHNTTLSFSEHAKQGFRKWLSQKYQSADALNRAWGNVFWSMEYDSIADIDLPNMTVAEANPSHWLDFRRYTSDQVIAFNRAQVDAMRPHTERPLIHNYMGRMLDFDHFALGEDLDIAAWDSYPTGFIEMVMQEESDDHKAAYSRQGDPDFQAFHHDLYRAVGKGRCWVMEQQPGPVNWAAYNPIPLEGMVRLWGMEAFAHGAEVVSYFRWRQAPFAQEQMHAGLLRPDNENAPALAEVKELAEELAELGDLTTTQADIAMVFDYQSQWAGEIQPQGQGFDYFRLLFEQYRALRQLGLSIDILPSTTRDFGNRKLVLIPGLMTWNDRLLQTIRDFNGMVIAGPRTGLKTPEMHIPIPLGPGFADTRTMRVASLRPNVEVALNKGGHILHWYEEMEILGEDVQVIETSVEQQAVMTRQGKHLYLGAWLDNTAYQRIFTEICAELDIATIVLPEGLRLRTLGERTLVLNYSAQPIRFEGHSIAPASYHWR